MRGFDPLAAAAAPSPDAAAKQQARDRARAAAGKAPQKQQQAQQKQKQEGGGGGGGAAVRKDLIDDDGEDLSEFLVDDGAGAGAGSKRGAAGAASSSSEGSGGSDGEGGAGGARRGWPPAGPPAPLRKPQVIFCSRTHSQLSQFVGELHRTRFADTLTLASVASRRALCVNDDVAKLGDLNAINERCMELQQQRRSGGGRGGRARRRTGEAEEAADGDGGGGGALTLGGLARAAAERKGGRGAAARGCPYLRRAPPPGTGGSAAASAAGSGSRAGDVEALKDLVLASPADVEDLARMGRARRACPYYAARLAVPEADVVLAPYSALLSADARLALGLDPEGSVVVFDEAHNLLDAVNGAHGCALTARALAAARRQAAAYYDRFRRALSPANSQQVQLLLRVAGALLDKLAAAPAAGAAAAQGGGAGVGGADGGGGSGNGGARAVRVNELLFELGLDNINMFHLLRWVKESKFAFKASGYAAAAAAKAGAVEANGGSGGAGAGGGSALSAMHALCAFIGALTNTDDDGRVIVEPAGAGDDAADGGGRSGGRYRFVLLNAARHFGRLLSGARAVVLASGTLSPVAGVRAQLFPHEPPARVRHFECGHVVAAERLLALSVGRGPGGRALDFRHAARGRDEALDEAGALLLNLAAIVPGGLVAFAPSFSYLDQLAARWRATGLLARLGARKAVFVEPRGAGEVEATLRQYAEAISGGGGDAGGGGGDGAVAAAAAQAGGKAAASLTAAAPPADGAGGRDQAAATAPARPPAGAAGGALLLCVMGGKLSEGINFGDALGRCVVVLGLPYPNPSDPELRERVRYLDGAAARRAAAAPAAAAAAGGGAAAGAAAGAGAAAPAPSAASTAAAGGGAQYYEDLCFRAVNQAVGRVIRHRGDYAAVVLADQRWVAPAGAAAASALNGGGGTGAGGGGTGGAGGGGRAHPLSKLPGWIRRSFAPTGGEFGPAYGALAAFFRARRAAEAEAAAAAATAAVAAEVAAAGPAAVMAAAAAADAAVGV